MKEWSTLRQLMLRYVTSSNFLPAKYTRIAGITMNDSCYYKITDFKLKGSDTLRFSYSVTASCNVLGCYTDTSAQDNYSLYTNTSSGNYLRYNGGAYQSQSVANTKYDVVLTPTGSSGMKTDSTWTAKTFTAPADFCIGTTSASATSAKLKGTLYGNIVVDGQATFIPCKRNSDNAIGYYCPQQQKFFENQGSGTPVVYVPS